MEPTLADRVRLAQRALKRKITETDADIEKSREEIVAEIGAYSFAIGLLDFALEFSGEKTFEG